MKPPEFMKATWEAWESRYVRLVAVPLPPIKVRNLIYMPDSFNPKTFDQEFTLIDNYEARKFMKEKREYRAIDTVPSHLGPAILISIRLRDLIGFDVITGTLTVSRNSICATVSYRTWDGLRVCNDGTQEKRLNYAVDVVLDNLSFHSSCNPGSHTVVPDAPHLSALLQYAASPWESGRDDSSKRDVLRDLTYMTPEQGKLLFPGFDFTPNQAIDAYVAACAVKPEVKYYHTSTGVGSWVVPYLQTLRLNNLLMEDMPYEERLSRFSNPGQEDGRCSRNDSQRRGSDQELREEGHISGRIHGPEFDQGRNSSLGGKGQGRQDEASPCRTETEGSESSPGSSGSTSTGTSTGSGGTSSPASPTGDRAEAGTQTGSGSYAATS